MLFVNTRPAERSASLTTALQAQSVEVLELALLELTPRPLTAKLTVQFQQLLDTDVIVVVSPIAVDVGMQYLQTLNISLDQLAHIQWIAVGKTTAECLAQYGIQSHVPEVETSEGMLTLPVLKQLGSMAHLAFWRGEGGRQFMMQHLQDAGHQISNMLLYERQCPENTRTQLENNLYLFEKHKKVVVLITSEASWLNWLSVAQIQSRMIDQAEYWVLGTRLAQILQQYRQQYHLSFHVKILHDLKTETLVQELQVQ